jgi:glycosyltransferase involved in cell wall biosynthesis
MEPYVLVTPVRNEEKTVEETICAVLSQTVLPSEWVIVSDGSEDNTDEIVARYAAANPWIRLLRLAGRPRRNFASVVFATETGYRHLECEHYSFIGLLDADVRFQRAYIENLLSRFATDPKLGLAGGLVVDVIAGRRVNSRQHLQEVAGAVQFFRRACFEAIGSLVPLPEGGWDAITCLHARMKGFKTATFPDLIVEHLKPRNIAEGNVFRRHWQFGLREYALANHPLFEVIKCCARCMEHPVFVGALSRFAGYCWGGITRRRRMLPGPVIDFARREQLERLKRLLPIGGAVPQEATEHRESF